MIFQRAFFYCVTVTVWLMMGVAVVSYKSGCSGSYCFVVSDINNITERLDLSAAQRWCQSIGIQLVEIKNKDIQSALITFTNSQGSFNGLNILTNGKRSSSNWIRLSGNGVGNLDLQNQAIASNAYAYLTSTTSGFQPFASRPNDRKGGFICAGLKDCSGGITISGQCYKSFTEMLSWYDARNRCLDAGGDLASFENITSNAGFNALNGSLISASNSYWIGIRREWWTWQNTTSDVKYSDWISGHPINDDGRANSDCLCLSTPEWKWIECGCSQQLPFVCMADNISTTPSAAMTTTKTTTTTSTTTPSSASTTPTTPTTIATFKATLSVTSVNGGVSTPTSPGSVTLNSTSIANDTGSMDQQMGLSRGATIGIGVGVGVGGALVIAASIAAVIFLQRRCPRNKTANAKVRRPHIPAQNSNVNNKRSDEMENPYAAVVPPLTNNNNVNTNAEENSNQTSAAVYAQLDFRTEPQGHRDGSVIIVPGKTKPSPGPKPRTTNV